MMQNVVPFTRKETNYGEFRTVRYKVHGFWGDGQVSIYQDRNRKTVEWNSPAIRWAGGGRDANEEPDDLIAISCFTAALQDAALYSRQLSEDVGSV